jgi:hypothetical protein
MGVIHTTKRLLLAILGLIFLGAVPWAAAQCGTPLSYRSGWPVDTGMLIDRSTPAVGNLDSSSDLEVVVGTIGKKVYAFKPNGSVLPGWPVTVTAEVNSSPVIGDINGDGYNDVIVGVGWQDLSNDGGIFAFDRFGQLLPGWPVWTLDVNLGPNGHSDGVFATPALADLDGDGKLDVIVGTFDQYLYALRYDGTAVPGAWPFFLYDGTWSSPAVGDLDRDGDLEVVIGAYTHAGFPPGLPTVNGGGIMWVLNSDGTVASGWPQVFDLHIDSSPALGDLDGDGDLEIVFGTGHEPGDPRGHKVYALHHTGTAVTGWPAATGEYVWPSPALGDLDGDGAAEVVASCEDGKLYAWNGNGTALSGWPVLPLNESCVNGALVGSPVIADLDHDGNLEVVVPIGWDLVAFKKDGTFFKYGTEVQSRFRTLYSIGSAPTIADIDGNGRLDVLVGSAASSPSAGRLYAWELPAAAVPGKAPWAMFRGRALRDGKVAADPPSTSQYYALQPCRLLDTRESTGAAAAAPILAATSRRSFQITGKCSLPEDAAAVSVNITVTGASAAGQLKVLGDLSPTQTSSTSFGAGQTRANNATVRLSTDGSGRITVYNTAPGTVHFILDISGCFR